MLSDESRNFLCIQISELILPGLMNDMVTLILIASMALWKISPHVINVSIIRILTARLVAVVCYYVSVHCVGPSEYNGVVGICPHHLLQVLKYCFLEKHPSDKTIFCQNVHYNRFAPLF